MKKETKVKIGLSLKENHPRRYLWILISPENLMVRTDRMRDFCLENNLSYSALRYKAKAGDSSPVLWGPAKGWSVFATQKIPTIK